MFSILKNNKFKWNTTGLLLQNLLSPLILFSVIRINGLLESGEYTYLFALSIIFWVISLWGVRNYQVSDTKNKYKTVEYLYHRFLISLFLIIIAIILSSIGGYSFHKVSLLLSLLIFKLIESYSDVLYGLLQLHDKLNIVGKSLVFKSVTSITIFLIIDITTKNLLFSTLGITIVNMLWIYFYDLKHTALIESLAFNNIDINVWLKSFISISKECLPYFLSSISNILSLFIIRFFIDRYYPEENGYFSILSMPITLVILVVGFLVQPYIVHLSYLKSLNKINEIRKIVHRYNYLIILIGVLILILAYFMGVTLLNVIFNLDFNAYKTSMLLLIIGAIFNGLTSLLTNVFIIFRKVYIQLVLILLINFALLVLCVLTIKNEGIYTGSRLFLIFCIVQFISQYIYYIRLVHNKKKYSKI